MPKKPAIFKSSRVKGRQHQGRESSHKRGYDRNWRKARAEFLSLNPLCVCKGSEPRCNQVATVVDHKIPHKGDMRAFWVRSNWQSMSKVCHDIKTATKDGAFGRAAMGGGLPKSEPF